MTPTWSRLLTKLRRALKGHVYLVGGPARDLYIDRRTKDLDFLIEGADRDYAHVIHALKDIFPPAHESFKDHAAFRTMTWETRDATRIDCARPRDETYAQPGCLPKVSAAALVADDLKRRDFTVNAFAFGVGRPVAGRWIDPFAGRRDLGRRCLRLLHDDSFRDDPTRMLRGLRLATRLRLEMDARTQACFDEAKRGDFLVTVSRQRRYREFLLALAEDEWIHILRVFNENGLFTELLPALTGGLQDALAQKTRRLDATGRLFALYLSTFADTSAKLSVLPWGDKGIHAGLADIEALVSRRWRATRLPQASLMQALYAVRPEWWKRFSSRAPFFITGSYLKLLTKDPATRGRLQTKLVVAVLDGEVTDRRSAVTFLKRQIAQTDKTEHCIIE
ncbi:MAG: hypothetical protein AABZ44_06910 [Elusimicrobiota bacterium]